MSVWRDIVGQPEAVAALSRAAADAASQRAGALARTGKVPGEGGEGDSHGRAMSHAWLITGPPGSGRSNLAAGLAAALQCPNGGCGDCPTCHQVAIGAHPDVYRFIPERLQITAEEALGLIRRAVLHPVHDLWNVMIVEDADRLNETSGNALLKSIEEPNDFTVWVLCAPSPADVLPTIVSRTRQVVLRTPAVAEVTRALVEQFGAEPAMAAFAARAAQGHIGRARALATDERVRLRRHEILSIPPALRGIGACFQAAANLQAAAAADAAAITDALDAAEVAAVNRVYGDPEATGSAAARARRAAAGSLRDLEARQKSRRTRTVRDQLDRALLDLIGYYRDVLVIQVGASVELINQELRPELGSVAAHSDPVATERRIAALEETRLAIAASVAPLLALEALTVRLAGIAA